MSAFFDKISIRLLRSRLGVGLGALVICIIYILVTDPGHISLAFLLVPFVLTGICVYEVSYVVISATITSTNVTIRRIVSAGISFTLVLLLLLQSLNQLTIKDGLILVALSAMFWLYLWRADFLNK